MPPTKKQKPPYPNNLYLKKITELMTIKKTVLKNINFFLRAIKKKIEYINISIDIDQEGSL